VSFGVILMTMGTEAMIIREATAEDLGVLRAAGLEAMNWNGEARFTLEQFMSMPELSHYLEGWPRPGDFGVVAEAPEGRPVGAAWCRIFAGDDAGYGFVAPDIPELTIGVLADRRSTGVGTALIEGLIGQGSYRGLRAISLSVEDGNRARSLYERLGFRKVGRNGGSDTLLLELHRSPGAAPGRRMPLPGAGSHSAPAAGSASWRP
jgi:ribosomal protein S18 acetylase RimI-like enzyme